MRGGIEPALMSATTDKNVALSYATGGEADASKAGGILFCMSQGLVDRGANLSWLSRNMSVALTQELPR